jgi:hypothetical protein
MVNGALRLELSVNDYDTDGVRHVTHWWRPSRFGTTDATPIPGSGRFER